jgi:L-threonylcarbamoyladenylate synthase
MKAKTINIAHPNALDQTIKVLKNFGVVAFPTDTVYGLASMAFEPTAINKLYQIKDRDQSKAIAILIGNIGDLEKISQKIGGKERAIANEFWPGPLTLIVPRHTNVPDIISPLPTIGVRIPNHPFVIQLLNAIGPLAVTSANVSGGNNPQSVEDVLAALGEKFDLAIDGGTTKGGKPSTVLDVTQQPYKILREGPITSRMLAPFID